MESAKGMLNNGATPDVVSFAEETLADIASVATFDELVAAKTKEIDALIASIEDKTTAIGELGVQIVSMWHPSFHAPAGELTAVEQFYV